MSRHSLAWSLLAPMIALVAHAQAPEWKEVQKDPEKTTYIQVESVRKSKRGVQVWIKYQWNAPVAMGGMPNPFIMMKEHAEYSLARKWTLEFQMFNPNGKQVGQQANPPSDPGEPLVPNTAEAAIAKEVWAILGPGKSAPKRSK